MNRIKGILSSDFFKATLLLTSGTVIAQAISYLLMPIITRLFTPEDFGEFGLLMRIVGLIAVFGAGSYEFALPLPKRKEHAFHLFRFTLKILCFTVGLTFLLGICYWLFFSTTQRTLFYVIFITVIAGGTIFINIGRHWSIRNKAFKRISSATLLTSGGTNLGRLFTGFAGMGFYGLSIAAFIGLLLGGLLYFKNIRYIRKSKIYSPSSIREKVMLKTYQSFPKIDLPNNIIDTMLQLAIAICLMQFLDVANYGSFDHAFRMLRIPLLLIGASIGQVLYHRLAEDYAHQTPIYPLVLKITALLSLSSIPFSIIYFWGGPIFAFVFGGQWLQSGEIAAVIVPWLFANFIASTLSIVPAIIEELKWYFWLNLAIALLQLICFIFLPQIVTILQISTLTFFSMISWLLFILLFISTIWLLQIVKRKSA